MKNNRKSLFILMIVTLAFFISIAMIGAFMEPDMYAVNFAEKNLGPSVSHPFGTDDMGRDMLARTVKGLSTSLYIGIVAAFISAVIAVFLGTMAAVCGKKVDGIISWLVDLFLSIPHIVLIILISIVMGKGATGVMVGVAVSHWPSLTRVVRAEVKALSGMQYIVASQRFGRSKLWIAKNHMFPHILSQFMIGITLLFPHAILHEAAVTFLGFGLLPETPAIGIILAESMKYLATGSWWLAVFPGLCLFGMVFLFYLLGENIKKIFLRH